MFRRSGTRSRHKLFAFDTILDVLPGELPSSLYGFFTRTRFTIQCDPMAGFRFTSPKSNVNLWVVPLKMSLAAVLLFAITMIPDMLDAYHVIHIPGWFAMGGI